MKELSKDASSLLNTINRGLIDIPKIKNFLSRVEQLNAPSAGKLKRIEKKARVDSLIK